MCSRRLQLFFLTAIVGYGAGASAQRVPHARQAGAVARSPVTQVLQRVAQRLRRTRYVHVTRIDEAAGRFDWDCSGMAAWVLARSAPHAHQTVMQRNGRGRPVASDYHDVIAAAPTDRDRGGWRRVPRAMDLRAGDLIAWRRPPSIASHNTGHVMFVASAPRPLDREGRRFAVRVIDSTSIPHGDDTRVPGRTSGYGQGTIVLFYDNPRAEPVAYGWYGLATRVDFRTHLALGRAER